VAPVPRFGLVVLVVGGGGVFLLGAEETQAGFGRSRAAHAVCSATTAR